MKWISTALAGATLSALAMPAHAATIIQYDITTKMTLDVFSSQIFGASTSPSIQNISMSFDKDAAFDIPANTAFSNWGITFPEVAHAFSKTAVTAFDFTVGFKTWNSNNLVSASSLSNGNYDVLLTGDYLAPSRIYFLLSSVEGPFR